METERGGTRGIRLRPASLADAAQISRVHVDTWRTAYAGILPAEYLASLSYRDRERMWNSILFTDHNVFVAVARDDKIIGLAHGGLERGGDAPRRAELYAIYVLEEHQGNGIGRCLIQTVAQRLRMVGFNSMLAWVLSDNQPARRFYESIGGEQVAQQTSTIGGLNLVEVAYVWKDISSLKAVPNA